jgi:TRAP-type C4-dicarboxylate transport system substrate-binding protein
LLSLPLDCPALILREARGPAERLALTPKIRVPVSPLWTSTFQALGASPVSINFAEAYSALQTRIADGQENPLTLIYIAKFYEVQKYCAMTNHMWDGLFNLMNGKAWRALPPDLQAVLANNMNGAVVKARGDLVDRDWMNAGNEHTVCQMFREPPS